MKTALVYDRVNKWGGAERVLLALNEIFPDAPLFTAVYSKEKAPWANVFPKVIASFLQKIPILKNHHELLGAFTPIAFESFDFSGYDLVISVTSEAAKGIITKPGTVHICFCLTPTRYLWSHYNQYFKGTTFKGLSLPVISYLRKWDYIAGQRPDHFVAISTEVKERIKKYYNRDSVVIHPPLVKFKNQISKIKNSNENSKILKKGSLRNMRNYYLVVSRMVPYKRVDLVLETFSENRLPLVVVGTGSEEIKYKFKYKSKENIKFLGFVDESELPEIYQGAKAFIMPQEEDFGLTSIEAQSFAIPVIAYKRGGALETVVEGKTGTFFDKQTKESLNEAILYFEKMKFEKKELIENANRFSKDVFKAKFEMYIESVL